MNKNALLNLFVFCLIFLSSSTVYPFPVFYTCENEVILGPSKIDSTDLFEKILLLNKDEQNKTISSWCHGGKDCIERFKFIVSFSTVSEKLAMKVFYKELAAIKESSESEIKNPDLLESVKNLKDSFYELQACQNSMNKLNGDDYITQDNSLIIPYPFHNNYMRITGCKSVSGRVCKPVAKNKIDTVIEEAIAMGTDPYLAIAINFMEGQPEDMGNLSLDPIGVMDIIGCRSKREKKGGKGILNSYQTYYKVNKSVVQDTKLSNKLKSFMTKKGTSLVGNGKSHYCYDVAGKTKPRITTIPQKNSCCLELEFKTPESSSGQVTHALTYEFINRKVNTRYKGKTDPAWRIQRFNGFTNLMGGAEAVPAWRVGVNYRKNPGYGQQTMDYILNSLMFNPYISNKINKEKNDQKKKVKSILCSNKKDGTYYYESNKYFDKVKSSVRLGVIADKFNLGGGFNELTPREQSVIKRELLETATKNSKMPNLLRTAIVTKYESQVSNALKIDPNNLFKKTNVSRIEIWDKKDADVLLSRGDFDYIMDTWDREALYNQVLDKTNLKIHELEQSLNITCQKSYTKYLELYELKQFKRADKEYVLHNNCIHSSDDFVNEIYNGNVNRVGEILKETPSFTRHAREGKALAETIFSQERELASFEESRYEKMVLVFSKHPKATQKMYDARTTRESIGGAISRISELPGYNSSLDKGIRSLYMHQSALDIEIDYPDAYQEYFSKLYKDRRTLEMASDYSWKKLNQGQVQDILGKILKN